MSIVTWRDAVLPRLPGALQADVDAEIKIIIERFCRDATAWRKVLYDYDIVINDREIELDPVDGGVEGKVAGILRVYYDGTRLTDYSHVPFEVTSDYPTGWTQDPEDTSKILLSYLPISSVADKINAWVFLVPLDTDVFLPDVLLETHWEDIFDGVMGRMYQKPNKPWTDLGASAYHLKRFRTRSTQARDMANRGYTGNAQNWTFNSFGR